MSVWKGGDVSGMKCMNKIVHIESLKEVSNGRLRDVIIEITHDDDLLLLLKALMQKGIEILKNLGSWTCLIVFGAEVSTVLLIHSIGAVWIWTTGAVYLNNAKQFVVDKILI